MPNLRRRIAAICAAATAIGTIAGPVGAAPEAPGAEASAAVTKAYYDRSFIVAADARCRMFAPELGAALSASALQARGAAARAGADESNLIDTGLRARAMASTTACDDPQLAVVRGRVASAYSGWISMRRMEFPGDRGLWKADRTRFTEDGWRLVQTTTTGSASVAFGLVAGGDKPDSLAAVVSFVGESRPYAVRVVMRNAELAPRPWLVPGGADLPPEAARRAVFASGNLDAGAALMAPDHKQGEVWLFRSDLADVLAGLDPREPFVVEFLFRDDSIARARFEAGDFAAARAFTSMGPV